MKPLNKQIEQLRKQNELLEAKLDANMTENPYVQELLLCIPKNVECTELAMYVFYDGLIMPGVESCRCWVTYSCGRTTAKPTERWSPSR